MTALDPEARRLIVTERHTLEVDDHERSSDYQFVMQCWTRDELQSWLCEAGFGAITCFGAYDPAVAAGDTDRLVTLAQRSPRPGTN